MRTLGQQVSSILVGKSEEIVSERELGQSRNDAQLWISLVVKVKSRVCKEQYCIGTWNVRSRNQGKLDIVIQETATVNINIWGISELKCMGMGKFNSDGHYIYYCGQESLKRNGVTHTETKRSKMQDLDAISKMTQWSWFISKANHST